MTTPQLPPLPEQSMTHHITDEQIAKMAYAAGFSPALVATDGGAFGRLARAALAQMEKGE